MNPRAARWFWGIVAAQVLLLLGWAGYHESVRRHAPVVLLKTKPVDPRDLLRGDYMILGYEIADVPLSDDLPQGSEVWVVLEPRGEHHVAVAASAMEPALAAGQIAVRARRDWRRLQFGIENFYVPEGRGTPEFKTLEVEASVSPTHRLYIRRVLLDGAEYP